MGAVCQASQAAIAIQKAGITTEVSVCARVYCLGGDEGVCYLRDVGVYCVGGDVGVYCLGDV